MKRSNPKIVWVVTKFLFTAYPLKEYLYGINGAVGIGGVILGIVYFISAAVTIFWIKQQQFNAQQGMEGAAMHVIFPIYLPFLWFSALSDSFVGLVILFCDISYRGTNPWPQAIAASTAFSLQHFVIEGTAFVLMQYGCGYQAVKQAAFWATGWALTSFLVQLMLYRDGATDLAFTANVIWNVLQLVLYGVLWFAPAKRLFRRGAVVYYSRFWFVLRLAVLFQEILFKFGTTQMETTAANCIYAIVLLPVFILFKPYVVYKALLYDSKWWQGLSRGGRVRAVSSRAITSASLTDDGDGAEDEGGDGGVVTYFYHLFAYMTGRQNTANDHLLPLTHQSLSSRSQSTHSQYSRQSRGGSYRLISGVQDDDGEEDDEFVEDASSAHRAKNPLTNANASRGQGSRFSEEDELTSSADRDSSNNLYEDSLHTQGGQGGPAVKVTQEPLRAPLIGIEVGFREAQALATEVDFIKREGAIRLLNFAYLTIDSPSAAASAAGTSPHAGSMVLHPSTSQASPAGTTSSSPAPKAAFGPAPATSIGHVSGLLGTGSFSKVYAGWYKNTRRVAIKMLFTQDLNPDVIRRYSNEARILSELAVHRHVVQILGVCVLPPSLCIVLEICEYGSLSDVLRGNVNSNNTTAVGHNPVRHPLVLTVADRMYLALGCARGLAALHAYAPDLCHRDIKSMNFLVNRHFHVKIADLDLGVEYAERYEKARTDLKQRPKAKTAGGSHTNSRNGSGRNTRNNSRANATGLSRSGSSTHLPENATTTSAKTTSSHAQNNHSALSAIESPGQLTHSKLLAQASTPVPDSESESSSFGLHRASSQDSLLRDSSFNSTSHQHHAAHQAQYPTVATHTMTSTASNLFSSFLLGHDHHQQQQDQHEQHKRQQRHMQKLHTENAHRVGMDLTWQAPEVLLGLGYTQLSDVYSLGLVLWEILASGRTTKKYSTNSNAGGLFAGFGGTSQQEIMATSVSMSSVPFSEFKNQAELCAKVVQGYRPSVVAFLPPNHKGKGTKKSSSHHSEDDLIEAGFQHDLSEDEMDDAYDDDDDDGHDDEQGEVKVNDHEASRHSTGSKPSHRGIDVRYVKCMQRCWAMDHRHRPQAERVVALLEECWRHCVARTLPQTSFVVDNQVLMAEYRRVRFELQEHLVQLQQQQQRGRGRQNVPTASTQASASSTAATNISSLHSSYFSTKASTDVHNINHRQHHASLPSLALSRTHQALSQHQQHATAGAGGSSSSGSGHYSRKHLPRYRLSPPSASLMTTLDRTLRRDLRWQDLDTDYETPHALYGHSEGCYLVLAPLFADQVPKQQRSKRKLRSNNQGQAGVGSALLQRMFFGGNNTANTSATSTTNTGTGPDTADLEAGVHEAPAITSNGTENEVNDGSVAHEEDASASAAEGLADIEEEGAEEEAGIEDEEEKHVIVWATRKWLARFGFLLHDLLAADLLEMLAGVDTDVHSVRHMLQAATRSPRRHRSSISGRGQQETREHAKKSIVVDDFDARVHHIMTRLCRKDGKAITVSLHAFPVYATNIPSSTASPAPHAKNSGTREQKDNQQVAYLVLQFSFVNGEK